MRDYIEVIDICKEAFSLEVKNSNLDLLYANAYSNLGKYDLADEFFDLTAESLSEDNRYYLLIGFHQYRRKNFTESKLNLEKSVEGAERFDYRHNEIILFMTENEDSENLLFWFDKITKIEIDEIILIDIQIQLGVLEKKYNETLELIEEQLKRFPQNQNLWNNKGIILQEMGNIQEAKNTYRKIIELNPNDGLGYYNLSCVLALEENWNESLKNLKISIDLDKKYKEIAKEEKDFKIFRKKKVFRKLVID